ncbi:cysteine-rich CWC family protein [Variovorax sp. J22P240]|uniref:cysteine-rich CWC family protein n=1 Tax=unclassified Variovorax TaxID=663243 RepID=UPI002578731F|nr:MULTISPECIES: cysteine-rich CWC family protein [unclassified Variovorax]MDM0001511.1 cysteine-rich CWC family protein [Variovorax sp. J22P240]MDM0051061.1 cysteine-rich CWC family protein [Variovorax sp. J22R115]
MREVAGPDPSRCPLCGETNRCAMELARETGQAQPPCWCMEADFSADLLARVPAEKRRLACICARCAALAVVQD